MTSPNTKINLGADLLEIYDGLATTLDMDTGTFIRAVLFGAGGSASDLAMKAIERGMVPPPKRRARAALPWESDGENWHYGEFTLVREGDRNHTERTKKPGEGWFLHGPGFEPPHDLGTMAAQKAKDRATDLLASMQATARSEES